MWIKRLSELISIDTSQNRKENLLDAIKLVSSWISEIGGRNKLVFSSGVPSLVSSFDFGADQTIALVSHVDTVAAGEGWSIDPFSGRVIGSRVFGRGAADDKGGVIATLWAVSELNEPEFNVKLIVTSDEERGSENGVKFLLDERYKLIEADYAIIVDSYSSYLGIGASGVVKLDVYLQGKGGHAAYKHRLKNPVEDLSKLLAFLSSFASEFEKKESVFNSVAGRRVWRRITPTIVKAGYEHNVVPSLAYLGIDLRTLPEDNAWEVASEVKRAIEKFSQENGIELNVNIKSVHPAYFVSDKSLVSKFLEVSSAYGRKLEVLAELGGNDGAYFAMHGIPALAFGVFDELSNIHGPDESVSVTELEFVKNVLKGVMSCAKKSVKVKIPHAVKVG